VNRRTRAWAGFWIAFAVLVPGAATAQDEEPLVEEAAVEEPAVEETAQESGFKVDLRFWGGTHVSNAYDRDEEDEEPFFLPMGGLTLTFSPSRSWGVLLTLFAGGGGGEVRAFDTFNNNALTYEGDQDTFRLDVEALLRYTLPDSGISLYTGLRYVRFDVEGSDLRELSNPSGAYDYEDESNGVFFEAGVGFTGELSEDGRHRLFANLTLMVGAIAWDYSETGLAQSSLADDDDVDGYAGVDTNVGYQWTFYAGCDLSVRYRLFVLGVGPTDTEIIHGPELTLGLAF
jgi:hypothetical protein